MKYLLRFFRSTQALRYTLTIVVVFGLGLYQYVTATTPNPGHPWSEVGDGTFAVGNTLTATRTFTFPDANATVLTSNAAVTVSQGGTGIISVAQGDILYGSASNTLSALAKDTTATRYLSNTGTSNNPAWSLVDLSNGVTGNLGIGNGGTGASLSATNGGVLYSGASTFAVSAAGSSGQILRSAGAGAPTWSTATYPVTAGTSSNYLTSDGTNFVSTAAPTITTILTRPYNATGGSTTFSLGNNTSFRVGLFMVPARIVVNQISILPGTITTATTLKLCVYSEDGSTKKIDVTSGTPTANTRSDTTVSSVVLDPGNYYMVIGCTGSCSALAVTAFTSTSISFENGASIPTGKRIYEGTVTMTAGTCNSTLPTITASNGSTVNARLDN